MKLIRIDKYLADMGIGTRSEVKHYLKKGCITVNGEVIKKPELKVSPESDIISYQGKVISYVQYEYYMLHKPAGYVSAVKDNRFPTVLDLIPEKTRNDLFPVGRLDKDTEGLLLITNDGVLSHALLSPKRHVDKVYYAKVSGLVTEEDILLFRRGVDIGDEKKTLPAELKILSAGDISEIELTIREGRYHQVKRMFEAVQKQVIYLKRLSMGSLILDPELPLGSCRLLTNEELNKLIPEQQKPL